MRIKFNFDDIQCHLESFIPKAWFLLEPDDVQTVADLAKELANKFRLKCNSDCLQLTLDGCLLPHWESTRILRDDDTIRFVYCQFCQITIDSSHTSPPTTCKSTLDLKSRRGLEVL